MVSLVVMLSVAVAVPGCAAVDGGRMMIVGDSISHGSSGDYTWRYRLYKHLTANGIAVDFVGPRNDLENIMTTQAGDGDQTYADPDFDTDHDSQSGRTLVDEAAVIGSKVREYNPDYLLVLLGINDLGLRARTPAQVETDLRAFIDNARAAKPSIKLVLGRLLPARQAAEKKDFAAKVADVNARIVKVADQLATDLSPIAVAHTDAEFVASDHTWDGTHPNPRGELRVAAAFADRLAADFGLGVAYPRPYRELPLGPQQAPAASVAITGATTADLTWTTSVGATGYWVWTRTSDAEPWVRLPNQLRSSPWHMQNLSPDVPYQFRLQPSKGDNAGVYSNAVTVAIGAPK
jgi:lysophospholipase L1-like esterase